MKDLRLDREAYSEQTVCAVRLYDSINQFSPGVRYSQLSVGVCALYERDSRFSHRAKRK